MEHETAGLYVLDGAGTPRPAATALEWAQWKAEADETEARRVALTKVGDQEVSTVFTGIDYSFGDGLPRLWETLVFPSHTFQRRYTSHRAALRGHAKTVELVAAALATKPE